MNQIWSEKDRGWLGEDGVVRYNYNAAAGEEAQEKILLWTLTGGFFWTMAITAIAPGLFCRCAMKN